MVSSSSAVCTCTTTCSPGAKMAREAEDYPLRGAIMLYGRSFEFGQPDFSTLRRIDWSGAGGTPSALLYLPQWPDESVVEPVYVK